jgi:hypothetical protein
VNDPSCIDDQTYQTDVLAKQLTDFVTTQTTPGWVTIMAPSASHGGHTVLPDPAARHLGALNGIPVWRPTSFNTLVVNQVPHTWNGKLLPLPYEPWLTDSQRRNTLETLLAVDDAVGELFDTLESQGTLDRTAIILSSDNGVNWGEHALWDQSKACAYEECQRVPMIVRMPGGVGRVVDEPVLVTDLAPTIAALARVPVPVDTDGHSFEPLLRGATPPAPWRTDYCMEFQPTLSTSTAYRGVRDVAGGFAYIEYSNGSVELFDLNVDPGELVNVAGLPAYAADQSRLAERILEVCS